MTERVINKGTNLDGVAVHYQAGDGEWYPAQTATSDPINGEQGQIVRVAGSVHTHSLDIQFVAAYHGTLEGKEARNYHILARRASFVNNSSLHDIGDNLTTAITHPVLTGVEALEIVSDSAQDDPSPAGTGTYTVRIDYIASDYTEAQYVATLNGTAAVALPFAALWINGMEAASGGSSEVSAGNISIRATATPTNVYARIAAGGNKSMPGAFMVPDGFTAYMKDWDIGALAQQMDGRIRAQATTLSREYNDRYLFQGNSLVNAGESREETLPWLKVPERARIKISAIPGGTAGTVRCDGSFSLLLMQN